MSGDKKHSLYSPFLDITFEGRPKNWPALVALWFVLWTSVYIVLVHLYAFVLPALWGFETTVLVGIGTLVLAVAMGENND